MSERSPLNPVRNSRCYGAAMAHGQPPPHQHAKVQPACSAHAAEGAQSPNAARHIGSTPTSGKPAILPRQIASVGLLIAIACALVIPRLDRGWVPHDEGTIAHSADRVLSGELPHRDFAEVYTGGLSFINAAAFAVLGRDLYSPRVVLFGLVLLSIPAVYYLASLMLPWYMAITATALALVWGLPIYPAAMPSWYNLYLALIASAGLVRFAVSSKQQWLYFAGLITGLSCTIKITGAYFYCSALLFLLFHAQETAVRPSYSRLWSATKTGLLLLFLGAILALIRHDLGLSHLLLFVGPASVVVRFLLAREIRPETRASGQLVLNVARFTAATSFPALLFLSPYVVNGGIGAVVGGILSAPEARFISAASPPPPPVSLWAAFPLAAIILGGRQSVARRGILIGALSAVIVGAALTGWRDAAHGIVIGSMVWSALILVPTAMLLLLRSGKKRDHATYALFMVAAGASIMSLIQYPYWSFIYLSYVAPVLALLIAAVLSHTERNPSPCAPLVLCAFGLYAILWIYPSYFHAPYISRLDIPGAHLRVPADHKAEYERIVAIIGEHAGGKYIYAGPDAPEVYYLTGKSNPTPYLFEFLSGNPDSTIIRGLDSSDADAIVINRNPEFSARVSDHLNAEAQRRFPRREVTGRFEVRWRE